MPLLGIGDEVMIRNTKTPPERFAAKINGIDEASNCYCVTKLNKAGNNTRCPPWEVLGRALRMDDGTPTRDAEEYVIEKVTGTGADLLRTMTEASKAVQLLREENKALKATLAEFDTKATARFKALGETLISFCRDDEMVTAVRDCLKTGLVHKAKPVIESKPKALQNA